MVERTDGAAESEGDSNASGTTFDQAFDNAVAEVAAGGEGDEGDGQGTSEGQPGEDTDGGGSSGETSEGTDGQAGDGKDAPAEGEGDGDEDAGGATEAEAALLAQLSPPLRKMWNRHFTQKSQGIAAQERLLKALQADPEGTSRRILERIEAAKKQAGATDGETPTITKESLTARFKKIPGVNDAQASELATIFQEFGDSILAPVRNQLESAAIEAEAKVIDDTLERFTKDHPEFPEIEAEMASMMDQLPRGENIPYRKYLDHIHTLVMGDKKVNERVVKILAKQKKNAAAAAGKGHRAVPGAVVKPGTDKGRLPTFEESGEAALRGEVWGTGIGR